MKTKYSRESIQLAVNNSITLVDMCKYFNLSHKGGNSTYMRKLINLYNIDTSHFIGSAHGKNKKAHNKIPHNMLFTKSDIIRKGSQLKSAMLDYGIPHQCLVCLQGPEWNGNYLSLQIDHINGDNTDNRIENLRIICPNCHSQTMNYAGKKNKKR